MKINHRGELVARYGCFSELRFDDDEGLFETYGIVVFHKGQVVRLINDVTLEREKAFALVSKFNSEELSASHLDEAIESFLYDFEI